MDEVLFHVERRLEIVQIWSRELIQLVERQLLELGNSTRVTAVKQTLKEISGAVRSIGSELSDRVIRLSDPEYLFETVSNAFGLDFNRATLYALGFGFTIGSSLGLVIGICLQSPKQPSHLMRAVATNGIGRNSIFLFEDAPMPKLTQPDQVLIEVKYASLDIVDLKMSSGYGRTLRWIWGTNVPFYLGLDGVGIVAEVGASVASTLDMGSRVVFATHVGRPGSLAEYIVVDHRDVSLLPDGIRFDEAASLAGPFPTAWAAVTSAELTPKTAHARSILIHCLNSHSSVSWTLLQLCCGFRAETVDVTCPVKWSAAAKALGATSVLTLESGTAMNSVRQRYDVVFNTIGPVAHDFCRGMTSPSGTVVDVSDPPLASDSFGFISATFYLFLSKFNSLAARSPFTGFALAELGKLLTKRTIRPFFDCTYAPEELDKALGRLESAVGRTIVKIEPRRKNGLS